MNLNNKTEEKSTLENVLKSIVQENIIGKAEFNCDYGEWKDVARKEITELLKKNKISREMPLEIISDLAIETLDYTDPYPLDRSDYRISIVKHEADFLEFLYKHLKEKQAPYSEESLDKREKFSKIVESLSLLKKERRLNRLESSFYEELNRYKKLICKIKELDLNAFRNIYLFWDVEDEIIAFEKKRVKDYENEEFENKRVMFFKESILKNYIQLINSIEEKDIKDTVDNLISTDLSKQKETFQKGRPLIFIDINERITERILIDKRNAVKEIKRMPKKFRRAMLYSLNFLRDENGYYLYNRKDIVDAVLEEKKQLDSINKNLHYGIFMKFGLELRFSLPKEISIPSLQKERKDAFDATLSDIITSIIPLSNIINTGLRKYDKRSEKIIKSANQVLSDFIYEYKHLSVIGWRYQGKREELFKKISQEFVGLKDEKFFNSLALAYLNANNDESKDLLIQTLTKSRNEPVMEGFFTRFIRNWNLKSGNKKLDVKLKIINKLLSKEISDYDKFSICLSLQSKKESKEKEHQYNLRVSSLVDKIDNASNIIECATYEAREEFLDKLGEGAAGRAYLVHSNEFNKELAMKILKTRRHKPHEGAILSNLQHLNIVRVYYTGDHFVKREGKEVYSILMDYVDGKTLTEIMKEKPSGLDLDTTKKYSEQLLNGITYLRSKGIFHRDLNLDNLKINSEDTLKIIDFGIARENLEEKTKHNRRYGGETDLFSWGLITYKLATGKHLIIERKQLMGTHTFAERIKQQKRLMRDKEGNINQQYLTEIVNSVPKELQEPIILALENTGEVKDKENRILELYRAKREQKKKREVEQVIGKKLDKKDYERIKNIFK